MDVRTLFVAIALAYTVFGVVLLTFDRTQGGPRALRTLAAGFLLMAAGAALQAGRDVLPDVASVLLGNMLAVIGLSFQAWAVFAITGRQVVRSVQIVVALGLALLTILLVPLDVEARLAFACLIYSVLWLVPAGAMFTWRTRPNALRLFVAWTLTVVGVLYLVRLGLAVAHSDFESMFAPRDVGFTGVAVLYVALLIAALTVGFSLLLLSKQSADAQLQASLGEIEAIYATLPTGLLIVRDRIILRANPAVEEMGGYGPGELIGMSTRAMYPDEATFQETGSRVYAAIESTGHFEGEVQFVRRSGEPFWTWLQGRMLFSTTGDQALVMSVTDISEQKHVQAELAELATSDELTGQPNRRAFFSEATRAIALAQRGKRPLSVALLDLDRFKALNDRFGHAFGDECLRRVSQVGRSALRTEDVFARFGGDEFVVLFPDQDASSAEAAVTRLLGYLRSAPLEVHGEHVQLTATAGVAQLAVEDTIDELLARADQAMYEAKELGGDTVRAVGATPDPSGVSGHG